MVIVVWMAVDAERTMEVHVRSRKMEAVIRNWWMKVNNRNRLTYGG